MFLTNGAFNLLVPVQIGLKRAPVNPAIPKKAPTVKPTRYRPPNTRDVITDTTGAGPKRVYLDIQSQPPDVAYPPRPVPGSIADMDEIMRHCDFAQNKVRYMFYLSYYVTDLSDYHDASVCS